MKKMNSDLNDGGDYLYQNFYNKVWSSGVQGWGGRLILRSILKNQQRAEGQKILEIGVGSGESLINTEVYPRWQQYVGLDLHCGQADPKLFKSLKDGTYKPFGPINFVDGSAESIPFPDKYFDSVISTCVLAHIRDAETALRELRRVTKSGGQIVIGMPCDPGALNRVIKKLITYPKMRRAGVADPKLIYAREHINSIGNLVTLINHVFATDTTSWKALPFRIMSWNFNLYFIFSCRIENL